MNETPKLTRSEHALALSLVLTCCHRAGRFTTERKYPACSDADRGKIREFLEHHIISTVLGIREPGPDVTIEELSLVIEEMGVAAVIEVLGEPPSSAPEMRN